MPGLSAACSAAIDAQTAIVTLFAGPVDGHRLSESEVAAVFDAIDPDRSPQVAGAVATLHDAATRSVGRSDVQVASILAEKKVADALSDLSDFIQTCSPPTS